MSMSYDEGHCRWWGWAPEPEMTGDGEGDPEKYFLTIVDERGEEIAVIVHRICNGKYPIDGDLALRKQHNAQVIVDALNANMNGHTFAADLQ